MEQKLCPGCEEPEIDKLPGCPLQCRTVQCKAYKKKPVYDFEIMPIIWILGGPGSGKSEQTRLICDVYGLNHLSVGEMLRAEMARGSERERCFNSVMGRGGLVPNDVVLALLKQAIEEGAAKGARGFVVDSFPREKSQGPMFERFIGPASLILYLEATVATLFKRIKERKKTPGRIDETPIAMKLRLETFIQHNDSIFELYKYRLVKIDANATKEEMTAQIKEIMDEFMKNIDALKAKKALETRQAELTAIAEQANRDAYVRPARRVPQAAKEEIPSKTESATKSETPSQPRSPSKQGSPSKSASASKPGTPSQSGSPPKSGSPAQMGSPPKPGSPLKPGTPT